MDTKANNLDVGKSLDLKRDKNTLITMADLSQDVKTAMTGGSVAVVGENTIVTKNVVDGQITNAKLGVDVLKYTNSKNLFNKTKIVINKKLDPTNGNVINNNGTFSTYYISVLSSQLMTLTSSSTVCFYTRDKTFISSVVAKTFTTPSNCEYIKFAQVNNTTILDDFQLEYGNTSTFYEENCLILPNEINGNKFKPIPNKSIDLDKLNFEPMLKTNNNLFNSNLIQTNKAINNTNGNFMDVTTGWWVSNKIYVEVGATYTQTNLTTVAYYQANGNFISVQKDSLTFTPPDNCSYIFISSDINPYTYSIKEGSVNTGSNIEIQLNDSNTISIKNYDGYIDVSKFPRLTGEVGDTPRIRRALTLCANKVLYIPEGLYEIDSTIWITNQASILMHKNTILKAASDIGYIIDWNGGNENLFSDYSMQIIGGVLDGNGVANGLNLTNIHHFTHSGTWYKDCIIGLNFGGGYKSYEGIFNNLYFRNTIGIDDSIAINMTSKGDHHFTDIIVVDYTIGFNIQGYSNRFTRCHYWCTDLIPVMSKSIAFKVLGNDQVFTDCYADTSAIGFYIQGDTRINCATGYHNGNYGGSGHISIKYISGKLRVFNSVFKGWTGANDIFFDGDINNSNVSMQWITCSNLIGGVNN